MDGVARNLSNVCRSFADWLWAASAYVRGPSGFSRSVTHKRNESPIFRETSALSPTEAAQCSSLTRLLITIVSRTMSSIDRKSGRPCGGKYKSPMSETMRCDIRDCETERTAGSPTRLAPSILIRIIIPRPPHPRFFIFSLLPSPVGRRETECVGRSRERKIERRKKSLVINSRMPIKNVQVGTYCSFFCLDLIREKNATLKLNRYTRGK